MKKCIKTSYLSPVMFQIQLFYLYILFYIYFILWYCVILTSFYIFIPKKISVNLILHSDLETEPFLKSQVSSGLLQTAQTWANAGVCGGLCACAVGGTFD